MSSAARTIDRETARREQKKTLMLSAVIVLCMGFAVVVARWIDSNPRPTNLIPAEERLYVRGPQARRMSLAFNGIVADWYWMRSLQYVGRKVTKEEKLRIDNLSELDLKLLGPLLDAASTLDPQFMAVYEYGAVVLPVVSEQDEDEEAIALLKKGIAANPHAWRLYQHLGYIHWQRGDYSAASEAYGAGARQTGAPVWMKNMEVNMMARGSTPEFAREIYRRMFDESDDPQIKLFAQYRVAQLDSIAERERIRRVLSAYNTRAGRCPAVWREVSAELRAAGLRLDQSGTPLDPTDMPYVLAAREACDVELHPDSKVPRK